MPSQDPFSFTEVCEYLSINGSMIKRTLRRGNKRRFMKNFTLDDAPDDKIFCLCAAVLMSAIHDYELGNAYEERLAARWFGLDS